MWPLRTRLLAFHQPQRQARRAVQLTAGLDHLPRNGTRVTVSRETSLGRVCAEPRPAHRNSAAYGFARSQFGIARQPYHRNGLILWPPAHQVRALQTQRCGCLRVVDLSNDQAAGILAEAQSSNDTELLVQLLRCGHVFLFLFVNLKTAIQPRNKLPCAKSAEYRKTCAGVARM